MQTDSKPQRRERRRIQTRSAILDAGERLFANHAVDSVSIDEIVNAADVAKGSFYNHFADKAGLAAAIVELVQGDCEFHIFAANRAIDDPATRMVRALCIVARYAQSHPDRLRALLSLSERRTIMGTPLNAGVVSDIEDGLEKGRFRYVTVEAGLLIAVGIIRITVAHAMTEASATPLADLIIVVGSGLLRGLGVEPAEADRLATEAARELFAVEQTS